MRRAERSSRTHPAALAASTPDGEADSWIMAAEDASLWQRVAAGDYYPHRVEDLSQVPVTRLAGRAAADEIWRAQIQGRTWLDAVVSDFAEHQAVNVFPVTPAVLVVAKSNSLRSYFPVLESPCAQTPQVRTRSNGTAARERECQLEPAG